MAVNRLKLIKTLVTQDGRSQLNGILQKTATPEIEEMADTLAEDVKGMGRATALQVLFCLGLFIDKNGEQV